MGSLLWMIGLVSSDNFFLLLEVSFVTDLSFEKCSRWV